MILRSLALFCLYAGLSFATAHSQDYLYATGSPAFSTQLPIDHGFVQVNNGEIHLEIPLPSAPQRGDFTSSQKLVYDSRIWKIVQSSGYSWQPTNVPGSAGGWTFQSGAGGGTLTMTTGRGDDRHSFPCTGGPIQPRTQTQSHLYTDYYRWSWTDPGGTVHSFPDAETVKYDPPATDDCDPPQTLPDVSSSNASSSDGTGYTLSLSNYTVATITDRTGTTYHPGSTVVTDRNGNWMSADTSGNLVDTAGNTPVLVTSNGNTTYYDVLGAAGSRLRYTVTYQAVSFNTAFHETQVSENAGSFSAIQSIGLPDGSSYHFSYNAGTYGDLASMTLPTGGVITYNYATFMDSFNNQNRWLSSIVKDGGTTNLSPSVYSICSRTNGCAENVTVTSPDLNDTVYHFLLDKAGLIAGSSWQSVIVKCQGSASASHTLRQFFSDYTYNTHAAYFYQSGSYTVVGSYQTPATLTQTQSLPEAGISSRKVITFAATSTLPTDVKDSDWYATAQGPPTAPATETTFEYDGAFPTSTSVKDGNGSLLAATTYAYDQTAPVQSPSTPPQHTPGINSHNLTTKSVWVNTSNSSLSTTYTYFDTGMIRSMTDAPTGATTTYGYDPSGTYLTTTILPLNGLTSSATYDVYAGVPLSTTDLNGTTQSLFNYDGLNRPGEIDTRDASGSLIGKSVLHYTATTQSELTNQTATAVMDKELQYDAYGRKTRTAMANGQSSKPWYQQDVCYDQNGRVSFTSATYQGPGFGQSPVCSGAGVAVTYDALDRTLTSSTPDGTTHISYVGPATSVTDEHGIQRISQSDAFGRPLGLCEVSSNTSMLGVSNTAANCGLDIPGNGFLTSYAYSFPNHTTVITQGSQQQRTFQTDSLSRSVMTQEPERGQTTYSYTFNSTGRLETRTRPQANQANLGTHTVSSTQYDLLGRSLGVRYTNDTTGTGVYVTPATGFSYDAPTSGWAEASQQTNMKGRMSIQARTDASGTTATSYSYDALGRVIASFECTPSGCGNAAYDRTISQGYDWTGAITSENDGGGAVYTYTRSLAGEVTGITSSLSGGNIPANVVVPSSVQNGPFGPTGFSLGNGTNQIRQYDTLGRNSGGWLCSNGSTTPGCAGNQLYGYTAAWSGSRVSSSMDTATGQSNTYGYDDFDRLSSTSMNNGQQTYQYVYDRWGNRWQQNAPQGGVTTSYTFDPTTNHINGTGTNNLNGLAYDAAGNLTNDGNGHTFTYDADGNVVAVDGGQTARYVYDAMGRRTRIQAQRGIFEFAFDADGQRVSTWNAGDHSFSEGLVYWDGQPIAFRTNGTLFFQHQDWIGTERLRTGPSASLVSFFTSLPFGDNYSASGNDWDWYHLAGLDFDPESNTDHATFRQYSHQEGRWMSPDPYDGSMDLGNPQSLNRYSYAANSPLVYTDPLGLRICNGSPADSDGPCTVAGGGRAG